VTKHVWCALLLAACAPSNATTTRPVGATLTVRGPERPALRPVAECAALMQRGERGEFIFDGEGVTRPQPKAIVLADPRRFSPMPRGTLDVTFDVTPYGQVDRSSLRALGMESWGDRARYLREMSDVQYEPGSYEGCAVRVRTRITITSNSTR
jgi:hypothetical protein